MAKFHFLVVCSLLAVPSHSTLGNAADPCDQDPCQNAGTCTSGTNSTEINPTGSPSTGYQCTCLNGYTGPNCEIDPCATVPCLNRGTCEIRTSSNMGYICRCRKNFLGKNCEREANACRSYPCVNEGVCRNRPATGSFICRCLPGTSGDQCEINADDCESSPCDANATCTDLVGGYECEVDFSSKVNVTCNAREMNITLDSSLQVDPRSVHLNSEMCFGMEQEGSNIKLSTKYGECGTTVEEIGDNIIFSNKVLPTKSAITIHNFLELPVQCILRKKEIVHGPLYEIIADEHAKPIQGHAQFELMLERYITDNFNALPSSGKVRIRDELFYAVSLSLDSSANLTVLLDACWATPNEDANNALRYDFIMDGCLVDHNPPVKMHTNLGPVKQGFSFRAFRFVGYPKAYVHCAVTVCVTNGIGCQQGCNASPRSLRRSLRDVLMKPNDLHSQAFLFSEHSRDGL